jgi:hypothetical protein
MGVFCLARRLLLLFHFCIFSRHMPTSEGCFPTSEGVILTSEGVILTKQAIFGRFFTRTNTLHRKKRRESVLFAHKTPCFGHFLDICSYPTYIPAGRGYFWCIWTMDLRSKIQRIPPPTTHRVWYVALNKKEYLCETECTRALIRCTYLVGCNRYGAVCG